MTHPTLLLATALLMTGVPEAQAQEVAYEPPMPLFEPEPAAHRLTLYSRAGALAYLSDARTTGGLGGGVGVRDTIRDRFILQADVNYLMGLGTVGALRLGAGVQARGTYTPALLVTLQAVVGSRLAFLTDAHPTPMNAPAVALGLSLAPVRFTQGRMQLSVMELGVGVGSDLPGWGVCWQLGLVEAGTTF